jgi:hypothetical protein
MKRNDTGPRISLRTLWAASWGLVLFATGTWLIQMFHDASMAAVLFFLLELYALIGIFVLRDE